MLVDGEPGFSQMIMAQQIKNMVQPSEYDFYYTTGRNIGTALSSAPTAGKLWRPIFHPVV